MKYFVQLLMSILCFGAMIVALAQEQPKTLESTAPALEWEFRAYTLEVENLQLKIQAVQAQLSARQQDLEPRIVKALGGDYAKGDRFDCFAQQQGAPLCKKQLVKAGTQ